MFNYIFPFLLTLLDFELTVDMLIFLRYVYILRSAVDITFTDAKTVYILCNDKGIFEIIPL